MSAQNHVQLDPALTGGFPNNQNHEPYPYKQNFSADQERAFNSAWPPVDPSLSQPAPYSQASFNQTWTANGSQAATSPPGPAYNITGARDYYNSQPYNNFTNAQHHGASPYSQPFNPTANGFAQSVQPNSNHTLSPYPVPAPTSKTISPAALQSQPSKASQTADKRALPGSQSLRPALHSQPNAYQSAPEVASITRLEPPKGVQVGNFLIIDFNELCKATNSFKVEEYLNMGRGPHDLPITKSTVPSSAPRKSRNELRRLAVADPRLAAKIAKSTPKKHKIMVPKVSRPKQLTASSAASPQSSVSIESSSESEESDDDSEYETGESDVEEAEPSPLPLTKPKQPLEGVRYDAIKAVWRPRNRSPSPDSIREGLKEFWELVRTIRDRWRTDQEAVKRATDAKKESELPMLKERVKSQRDMLEIAIRACVEHGHPDIIRLFGENKALMFAFNQFMKECINESGIDASFIQAALMLLCRCTTLTTGELEDLSFTKVLARIIKRGGDTVRSLAQQLVDSAAKRGKPESAKTTKPADTRPAEAKGKSEPQPKPTVAKVAGVKRSLGQDASTSQPAKRAVSGSTSALASSKGGSKSSVTSAGATTGTAKTKTVIANKTPTTNMFASLPSAKRPGSATAATKAKAATVEKKPQPPASSSGFSFAETMESFNKPKQAEVPAKVQSQLPPETEEERAKRLRKEERRKLRVMFKPDHLLTEIRVFYHDPEEEFGHDANMVRDVADLNSEGRMFRQHKDMMDVDEEDDEPTERTYFDFRKATDTDCSIINQVNPGQREVTYQTRGGVLPPQSPEKAVQEKHVANTMMVHYFTRSDIPSSPHEPADPYTGYKMQTQSLADAVPTDGPYSEATKTLNPVPDVSKILAGLGALLPQPQVAPAASSAVPIPVHHEQPQPVYEQQPQPSSNDAYTNIQNILAQYSRTTQEQPAAHQPQPQPQPQTQPHHQQPAAAPQPDLQSLLASLQAHGQSQPQQQQQPSTAVQASWPQQVPASWPTTLPSSGGALAPPLPVDPNAFFAMFGLNAGNMPNLQAYVQQQAQNASHNGSAETGTHNNHTGNRTMARDESGDRNSYGQHQDDNANKKWNHTNKAPQYRSDDGKPKFIFPCRYYKEGKCKKGANCTYRHDM